MSQHYLLILITVACALLPPTWVTLSELRRMRHSTPAAECDREAMVGVVVCDLLGSAVASLVVYAVQKAGSIDFTDQVFQQDPASRRAPSVVLVLLVAVGAGLGGRRALVAAERSRDVAWARLTPTQVLVVKSLRTVRSNALDRYAASIARWETRRRPG